MDDSLEQRFASVQPSSVAGPQVLAVVDELVTEIRARQAEEP